ncbi:MAG: dihydrolipoamide succinyltransferase, partial [Proteobacteria bacterium]|nr:dihydrolipoamide succinyltransferase [Pseudomonadota bacterium]
MSIAVELPELGESVIEGTVARWLVQVGDRVERDQPLVEVTTDKVDAEIPAPVDGVVEKILVMEGETVEVGTQLVLLDDSPAAVAAASPPSAPAEPAAPAAAPAAPETGAAAELRATPVARRMAEEARLDLQGVE